jgi:hypothetical protein
VVRDRAGALPAGAVAVAFVMQALAVGALLDRFWGSTDTGLVASVQAALAWSPWPAAVVVVGWLALLAGFVAAFVCCVRQAGTP